MRLFYSGLWLLLSTMLGAGCNHKSQKSIRPLKNEVTAVPEPPSAALSADETSLPEKSTLEPTLQDAGSDSELAPVEQKHAWSTLRLLVLNIDGPVICDIRFSFADSTLEEANQQLLSQVLSGIFADSMENLGWDQILDHPVIQSGWLGNLLPTTEQRAQVLSMYDEDGDGIANINELHRFATRGLSRNSPIQFSEQDVAPSMSVFGPLDSNQNSILELAEVRQNDSILTGLDRNNDGIVSFGEANGGPSSDSAMISVRSFLDSQTVISMYMDENSRPEPTGKDSSNQSIRSRTQTRELLQFYTIQDVISRSHWNDWDDKAWLRLDSDQNQEISMHELDAIFSISADVEIDVEFPNTLAAASKLAEVQPQMPTLEVNFLEEYKNFNWQSNPSGGQLFSHNILLDLKVTDSFRGLSSQAIKNQLETALGNESLQATIRQQLGLGENAFEVIDGDRNQKLSDEEVEKLWQWIMLRQGARLQARWKTTQLPWFQLLDANGDQRLSELERRAASDRLETLFLDGRLEPAALPLMVSLEIDRADQRLDAMIQPVGGGSPEELDWFSAMDMNQDGVVNTNEFLGDSDDFSALDKNLDGLIDRNEVY
ncbi:MAG: hypothetical protein KDB03_06495 [Planctomycetales bacterium]|nr:hypothetical protein [Planctomycetales bacterium]